MPKLWEESIEEHRRSVRDAITEAAWRLAEEHGPLSLTMSQVAGAAGIGRATLYKYFADIESILVAHHARHVEDHLQALEGLRGEAQPPGTRLVAVAHAYASICFHRGRHSSADISTLVHRGPEIGDAGRRLHGVFAGLIAEAAAEGLVRKDLSPDELAVYCRHALEVSSHAKDLDGVARLTRVVLDGLECSPEVQDSAQASVMVSHRGRAPHRS
ncbi:TetR/AcrR family transcriptional regulator [Promicromonospora sp. AC04]|uniref:TetR/AcrR family transcriptional regulator n=1 Tax=Promicromonospora sp. AC04 TaxID=2135723 RepID=UPI001304986C|nr:TetR/AcrR family transcriptional regulator [Promicromonospora sp. AC04]